MLIFNNPFVFASVFKSMFKLFFKSYLMTIYCSLPIIHTRRLICRKSGPNVNKLGCTWKSYSQLLTFRGNCPMKRDCLLLLINPGRILCEESLRYNIRSKLNYVFFSDQNLLHMVTHGQRDHETCNKNLQILVCLKKKQL